MKKIITIIVAIILTFGLLWLVPDEDPMKEDYGNVWVTDVNSEIRVKKIDSDEYEIFKCVYDEEGVVVESYGTYRSAVLEKTVDDILYYGND